MATNTKDSLVLKHPKSNEEITRESIQAIVSGNCLFGKGTEITGKENERYLNFERLNQVASDSLWFKLSYHASPVMRAYAYKALKIRNQNVALDIRNRLAKDSAVLCCQSNDTKFSCTVGYYVSHSNK